jgi:ABC-type Fe3+ transport system permease subunit
MLRVVIPLSLAGIQAGSILVFVLTISAYVIPILLGALKIKIMPTLVIQLLIDAFLWPFGAALAFILAASGAAVVYIFIRVTGRLMKGFDVADDNAIAQAAGRGSTGAVPRFRRRSLLLPAAAARYRRSGIL